MRHLAKITTSVLCATALGACHHHQTVDPGDVTYRGDTTSTSTSSTYVASTSNGIQDTTSSMSSGSMTPSTSTTRGNGGRMRGERAEVYSAIRSLDRAKYALEHASHEYGGHRTNALKAVDGALTELHTASGQEARPQTARVERVEDKEIHKAVVDLERARRDMETAKHNFGGRKTETLKAVDAALAELRLAAENEK